MSNHQRWPHFRDKTWGPRGTPRQFQALRALLRRNPDGTLLDIYQLAEALGDKSHANTLTTVRTLMAHGLVEKHDTRPTNGVGRPRRTYIITEAGKNMIRPRNLEFGN